MIGYMCELWIFDGGALEMGRGQVATTWDGCATWLGGPPR